MGSTRLSQDESQLTVAAVTGALDWSLRQTCSGEHFDLDQAQRWVASYAELMLGRIADAASKADIVVAPEYAWGTELFQTGDKRRLPLVEAADGLRTQRLQAIAARHNTAIACAGECLFERRAHETGLLIGPDGALLAVQPKHPRQIPPPVDWPFPVSADVYDARVARLAVLVCSDATYDPALPLRLSQAGMQVLLLPGCGFCGAKWRHFVVVRARDTQCPLVYADDQRAAIVDEAGEVLAETDQPQAIITAPLDFLSSEHLEF